MKIEAPPGPNIVRPPAVTSHGITKCPKMRGVSQGVQWVLKLIALLAFADLALLFANGNEQPSGARNAQVDAEQSEDGLIWVYAQWRWRYGLHRMLPSQSELFLLFQHLDPGTERDPLTVLSSRAAPDSRGTVSALNFKTLDRPRRGS